MSIEKEWSEEEEEMLPMENEWSCQDDKSTIKKDKNKFVTKSSNADANYNSKMDVASIFS